MKPNLSLLLVVCILVSQLSSCSKDDEALLNQLQSQKEEIENALKELPGASEPVSGINITFDKDYCWADAAESVTAHYTTHRPATVTAEAGQGWTVNVTASDETGGDIVISAPDPASPTILKVKAVDQSGNSEETFLQVFVRKPYGKVASPQIDVHAYYGFSDELARPDNFQKLVEAGVTMLTVEGDWEPSLDWRKQCRLAEEFGIKVILFIGGSAGNYSADPENDKTLENKVLEAITYPAVYAFQIYDEPSTRAANAIKLAKDRIEELAPGYPVYINLNPSGGSDWGMGATTYEGYVEFFAKWCDLTFITFDQYPTWEWGVEDGWYHSLNVVRDVSRRYGIPFWAFILSCREILRVDPTLETIRLQGNINVAYGAQCNQYFVWRNTSGTDYCPLVSGWARQKDGTYMDFPEHYTQVYYDCKEYDRELHNREFVFAGCDVRKVRHIGYNYYIHGEGLTTADLPDAISGITADGSALVSFIWNSDNEYLVICNKSYLSKLNVEIGFTRTVYAIDRDGEFAEQQPGTTSFSIDEGDMLVIKWK